MTKEDILQAIKQMSVLELSELVKDLGKEFGVSAMAPVAVAATPASGARAAATAAPAEEEKTEFTVVLQEIGPNKINVIKAVREVTSLGLREAKELVEGAPKTVKDGAAKDEAASIQKQLQEAGATVVLR